MEINLNKLAEEVLLERVGPSLEAKMASGLKEDVGIHRYEGLPFVWRLKWAVVDGEADFILDVWRVVPQMKDGYERKDRKPKLVEVLTRTFSQKV